MVTIGNDWDELLRDEFTKEYYLELREFLRKEYAEGPVYPPAGDIFNALRYSSSLPVRLDVCTCSTPIPCKDRKILE